MSWMDWMVYEGFWPVYDSFDMVEVMMDIEEAFGVSIPEFQIERFSTIGDLYGYLLDQACRSTAMQCPTSQAFFRIRSALIGQLGIDRSRIRPSTVLTDLIPAESGTAIWPRFTAAFGIPELPDPPPPRGPTVKAFKMWLTAATIGSWALYFVLTLLPGNPVSVSLGFWLWFGVVLIVCEFFGIIWVATRSRVVPVPKVRDLVFRLTAQPKPLDRIDDQLPAGVWIKLVAILSMHTGVSEDRIRPEHLFYDWGSNEWG